MGFSFRCDNRNRYVRCVCAVLYVFLLYLSIRSWIVRAFDWCMGRRYNYERYDDFDPADPDPEHENKHEES